LTLACLASLGCAALRAPVGIPVRAQTRFRTEWRDYLWLPGEKAIAVAGDVEGLYVSGVAHGLASAEAAVREAVARCERRRVDRGIAAACRLYAVGDRLTE
jgi:hypothetical protein